MIKVIDYKNCDEIEREYLFFKLVTKEVLIFPKTEYKTYIYKYNGPKNLFILLIVMIILKIDTIWIGTETVSKYNFRLYGNGLKNLKK